MDSDRTGGRKVVCDCQNCLKHSSTGARVHRSTAYQHRKNALADELLARAMESRPSKSVKDLRTGNSPFTSTDTPRGMLSAARDVITDAVQAASTLADLELAYRNLSAAEPFQPSDLLFLFLPDLSVSTLEDSIDAEERCLDQQDGRTGAYVSHLLVLRRFCIQVNQVRDRLNETFLNTVAEELSAKASDLLKLHREVLVQASLAESRRRQTVEDMKRDGVEVIHIGTCARSIIVVPLTTCGCLSRRNVLPFCSPAAVGSIDSCRLPHLRHWIEPLSE